MSYEDVRAEIFAKLEGGADYAVAPAPEGEENQRSFLIWRIVGVAKMSSLKRARLLLGSYAAVRTTIPQLRRVRPIDMALGLL